MTYFFPLFDFLPILHLRGPAESGKSRLAHVLAALAFNGATFGCATDATLFRYAHEGRYTQLITEADHLSSLGTGDRFVRQLQSACSKAEASVDVAEGGRGTAYAPATYHTFCPRVLVSTLALRSQPLRSRCIRLDLIKDAQPDEGRLRMSVTDDAVWAPLRDQLYRLQLGRWREVRDARDRVAAAWVGPGAPTGRAFEKWLPLATLASLIAPATLAVVQDLAREDVAEHQRDAGDRHEAHLALFALWLTRTGDRFLSRAELREALLAVAGRPLDEGAGVPTWAADLDVPVTVGALAKRMPSQTALVRELQRLKLIGNHSEHTRTKNVYPLTRQRAVAVAKGIIGEEEVGRILGEGAPSA